MDNPSAIAHGPAVSGWFDGVAMSEVSELPNLTGERVVVSSSSLEGAELYREAIKDTDLVRRYSHGTPDDWLERKVYAALPWQGVGLMLIIERSSGPANS